MEAFLEHTLAPGVSGLALFRLMPEFKRNTLRTFDESREFTARY